MYLSFIGDSIQSNLGDPENLKTMEDCGDTMPEGLLSVDDQTIEFIWSVVSYPDPSILSRI